MVFAWRGQPGVACLTPVAWLPATRAGPGTLNFTCSTERATRRAEAGLAGGLLACCTVAAFALAALVERSQSG